MLTVDSGAGDTVVPPSVCRLAPLHMTNKVGVEYEVANGAGIENPLRKKTSSNEGPKVGKTVERGVSSGRRA